MPDLFRPRPPQNLYHEGVTKKPKKPPEPDPDEGMPESREDSFIHGLKSLIGVDHPVMVTGWLCMVEYMDDEGAIQLGSFVSGMPPWRLTGFMETGFGMLLDQYEDWEAEE